MYMIYCICILSSREAVAAASCVYCPLFCRESAAPRVLRVHSRDDPRSF